MAQSKVGQHHSQVLNAVALEKISKFFRKQVNRATFTRLSRSLELSKNLHRLIWSAIGLSTMLAGSVLAQNAFRDTNPIRQTWSEASADQDSRIGILNTEIGTRGAQTSGYSYKLDTRGLNHFTVDAGDPATLAFKTGADGSTAYLDYEQTRSFTFSILSEKIQGASLTEPATANSLTITITVTNVDERPTVVKPYDSGVGKQIYLSVQDGTGTTRPATVRVSDVFKDPEGNFIRLKHCADDFTITETLSGGNPTTRGEIDSDYDPDATGNARHCAITTSTDYDATKDVRAGGTVVNIVHTFTASTFQITPIAATGGGTSTAVVRFKAWVGNAVNLPEGDTGGINHTPEGIITVHVRTGVNNAPQWGGITGFSAMVDETLFDEAIQIGPTTTGAWNATDLDGDEISYSLDGQAANNCLDDADERREGAISAGNGCVWLNINSGNVEIWGQKLEFETGPRTFTVTLVAEDGYFRGRSTIPITVQLRNVDEPITAPENIPALRNLVVGFPAKSADLNDFFSDPEGVVLTYSVESLTPNIVSAQVVGSVVTITPLLAGSGQILISARAGASLPVSYIQDINVRADNAAPTFVGNPLLVQLPSIAENSPVGTLIYSALTLRYNDADGDVVTASLIGSAPFEVEVDPLVGDVRRSGELALKVSGTLDYETTTLYEIQIRLSDGWEESAHVVSVNVPVANVNEAPYPTPGLTIPPQTVAVNGKGSIDVRNYFRDPEGDRLIAKVRSNAGAGFADVTVSATVTTMLEFTGKQVTTTPIQVPFTIEDDSGLVTRATFTLTVSPNNPPRVVTRIPDQEVKVESTLDVPLSQVFTDDDPEDTIDRYMATSSDESVLLVRVPTAANYVTLIGYGEGVSVVTITGYDSRGGSAQTTFRVTVIGNEPPVIASQPSDVTLVRGAMHEVSLVTTFRDPDEGDRLTYSATSSSSSIASVSISGTTLTVTALDVGATMISIVATDQDSESVTARFNVSVENIAPKVVGTIADQSTNRNETVTVDVSSIFADDDGDALTYEAATSNTTVATVSVSGASVTVTPLDLGSVTITVTANDGHGGSINTDFMVTVVNLAPVVAQPISAISLQIGSDDVERDLSNTFSDDGDTFTLAASVDESGVATVSISGMMLTVTAVSSGTATLTVTATDVHDASVEATATITVSDSEIKAVGVNALASFGRAVLAGVSSSVGARLLSDSDLSYGAVTALIPDSNEPTQVSALTSVNTSSMQLPSSTWTDTVSSSTTEPAYSGLNSTDTLNMLLGDGFFMNLGAVGDPTYYSIWGSFSTNSFEGAAYEGDTSGFFVGGDLTLNGQWTFGLAVGSNSGEADYTFGSATRSMDNSLTTILPYIRIMPSERTTLYGVLGFGSGEMETAIGSATETADLSASVGLFGGKQVMFASGNGLTVAVLGDFGFANLETDDAEMNASSGLVADTSRIRGGVEGSMNLAMGTDGSLVPYLNLSFRSDGGDGETGSGVELTAGARVSSPAFAIDAQFRTLLTSGVDEYTESGFSATATVNPGRAATGFSMSLSPRWGADAFGSDMLWDDSLQLNSLDQHLHLSSFDTRDTFYLASKMSYGMEIWDNRFNLKPYVNLTSGNQRSTTMMFGTELLRTSDQNRQMSIGLAVGEESSVLLNQGQKTAKVQTKLTF